MAAGKVFLGVDADSNMAIALEHASDGVFFLSVSQGPQGPMIGKFLCNSEDLANVTQGEELEISGHAGTCALHPAGDHVVIEYRHPEENSGSTCTVSMASYSRLLRVVSNRAYAS